MIPQGCRACGANYVAIRPRMKAKEKASKWKSSSTEASLASLFQYELLARPSTKKKKGHALATCCRPAQRASVRSVMSSLLGFHLGTTATLLVLTLCCFCSSLKSQNLLSYRSKKIGQIALLARSSLQLKCLVQVIQGFPQTVAMQLIQSSTSC